MTMGCTQPLPYVNGTHHSGFTTLVGRIYVEQLSLTLVSFRGEVGIEVPLLPDKQIIKKIIPGKCAVSIPSTVLTTEQKVKGASNNSIQGTRR